MANIDPMIETYVEINPLEDDPFQGEGAYMDIEDEKTFNMSQLASELEHKTGRKKVSLALINHNGTRRLWFAPKEMDKRTVRGAIKSHRQDEDWGLTEDQTEVRALLHRLKSGETLSVDQTTQVLKAMIEDKEHSGSSIEEINS